MNAVMDRRPYPTVRAVGGVLMLLLVGASVAGAVPSLLEQEQTEEATLAVDMARLVLSTPAGDVRITELPPGEQPRVQAEATWTLSRPALTTSESAGRVQVEAPCSGNNLGVCSVDLTVWVPEGTALEVTSAFGDTHVSSSGEVTVRSTVGKIVVDGEPERVDLTSTLSDVRVTAPLSAPDAVRVRTSVGDVDVRLPESQRYAVSATSDHGTVRVQVPRDLDSAQTVDIETTWGDVHVSASD